MADLGTGEGGRERGPARVGEEVEDGDLAAGVADGLADPTPLGALFGEDAEMSEVGAGETELDVVDGDFPMGGKSVASVPVETLLAIEGGVGAFPFGNGALRFPDRLRTGAGENHAAKALKLASVAAVEQVVSRKS